MKIAFVGKGGSGKTTVSSLFARYLASEGVPVLAIDADINQHLGEALGFTEEELSALKPLGAHTEDVQGHVKGGSGHIRDTGHIRPTTPPSRGSRAVYPRKDDPLVSRFVVEKDGVLLARTGPFEQEDLGMMCYHGKTFAADILLTHLADRNDEYVIVDMTAGADAFSSGLFLKFDLLVLVTEPTNKSLAVYDQYKEYGKHYRLPLAVIGNKIEGKEDESFIRARTGEHYLASLPRSAFVKDMERGVQRPFVEIEPGVIETLRALRAEAGSVEKDWDAFYGNIVKHHAALAERWLNKSYGYDMTEQIDPQFSPREFYENS